MRYLITGGLGVVGSCIVRKLLSDGNNSVVIFDSCEEIRNHWIHDSLRYLSALGVWKERIEISKGLVGQFVRESDAVIHCAASTGIPYSVTEPNDDWERNVDATRVLLEALRKTPKPTVVLSSVKPYRVDPLPPSGLDESVPLEPDEPYAASKAAQSMLCMAYAKSYDLPIVTFRCSNLYGPAPCHGPRHGWLTWFCISAAIGRPIEVQGTGEQSRDMLYADDVYNACMVALENASRLKGEVFNIGGGKNNQITVSTAAELLRNRTGVEIKKGPPRAMDDDHVFVNYGKFLKATGWRPYVNVEQGISNVLKWAQINKSALEEIYRDV